MRRGKSVIKNLLRVINVGIIIAYLCTFFIPYIDAGDFWMISLLGLGFPIIFFSLLAFMALWILWRSRWWLICLVVLLTGYRQIFSTFAFHYFTNYTASKNDSTLKVMHWNVKGWDDYNPNITDFDINKSQRSSMMKLIAKENPDVLLVQEFYENENRKKYRSNYSELSEFGFRYHISATDFQDNEFYTGIAIFSKFPILNPANIPFEEESKSQSLLYGDIEFHGKRIRLMTTHLQSVKFKPKDYQSLSELKRGKTKNIGHSKSIVSKLKSGYKNRYDQANIVRKAIDISPYPVILTGDFNDVPTSYSYYTISKNLNDAFLKKGSFIGRTFRYISPTLRIDYILSSKTLNIDQFKIIHVNYSDHYPLIAEFKFP